MASLVWSDTKKQNPLQFQHLESHQVKSNKTECFWLINAISSWKYGKTQKENVSSSWGIFKVNIKATEEKEDAKYQKTEQQQQKN